jgi:hypothetical protein
MIAELWISAAELANLPTTGTAWDNVVSHANSPINPDLSDGYEDSDVNTMAAALVYARTGDESYRSLAIDAIASVIGTEGGGSSAVLYLGRGLVSYVLAADLVGLPTNLDAQWRAYLDWIRTADIGSSRTLVECHEERPNNWGTHCGASRLAASLYLGDLVDSQRAASVWHGWLGDRTAYAGFNYGDLCWQSSPNLPRGINPVGATINGLNVDGVLPDDQRRGGCPPSTPCENYVREGLQGVLGSAILLTRQGYPAFEWEDQAILRAFTWLDSIGCDFPGDDEWEPWVANWAYGTDFAAQTGARPGKGLGFTDWTHASGGPPPACPWDLDTDGDVDANDLLLLLGAWGDPYDTEDLLSLLGDWGACNADSRTAGSADYFGASMVYGPSHGKRCHAPIPWSQLGGNKGRTGRPVRAILPPVPVRDDRAGVQERSAMTMAEGGCNADSRSDLALTATAGSADYCMVKTSWQSPRGGTSSETMRSPRPSVLTGRAGVHTR